MVSEQSGRGSRRSRRRNVCGNGVLSDEGVGLPVESLGPSSSFNGTDTEANVDPPDTDRPSNSRRSNSSNREVRGPTSALSSFLRDKGIKPKNVSIYTRVEAQAPNSSNRVGDSILPEPNVSLTALSNNTNSSAARSLSTKDLKKKLKRPGKDHDSGSDDDDALPKKRSCIKCCRIFVGSREEKFCSACLSGVESKVLANWSEAGGIRGALPSASRRKKPKKRSQAVDLMLNTVRPMGVQPLKELCVRLVCEYISDVSALGDIPPASKHRISKILSKMRLLDPTTVMLFLTPLERELKLYDCTLLTPQEFSMIPAFAPNLQTLYLAYCGRLRDDNLSHFAERLPQLSRVTLKGCFLVSDTAFAKFFRALGARLETLCIENASKLSVLACDALVGHCTSLKTLSLRHCSKVGSKQVENFAKLNMLESLDFSWSGEGHPTQLMDNIESDPSADPLVPVLGATLDHKGTDLWTLTDSHLFHEVDLKVEQSSLNDNVSQSADKENYYIDCAGLEPLLKACGKKLTTLSLCHVSGLNGSISKLLGSFLGASLLKLELEGAKLEKLDFMHCFSVHRFPNLKEVNLKNCTEIDDETFCPFIEHYGPQLHSLNICGLNQLGSKSLELLGNNQYSSQLRKLDVSWVRALSDSLFMGLVYGSVSNFTIVAQEDSVQYFSVPYKRSLIEIKVFGCFLLSAPCVKTLYRRGFCVPCNVDKEGVPSVSLNVSWESVEVIGSEFD